MILSIEERNFIENTYEIVVGVELSLNYQIKKILDLCLKIDYELDVQQKIAENNDRIELQIASARGHLDRLVASQNSVIDRHRMAGGRDSLIKASKGKIDRLQKQFEVNLAKLNIKRQLKHRLDDVAYFVVNVGKE